MLSAIKISPRPIGKIFGPTDEPYALSEIFWLSMKKSRPTNKKAIPATRSNFTLKIIPPNRKGDRDSRLLSIISAFQALLITQQLLYPDPLNK